jgi:hypothetical protein
LRDGEEVLLALSLPHRARSDDAGATHRSHAGRIYKLPIFYLPILASLPVFDGFNFSIAFSRKEASPKQVNKAS